jgi:hypothetical protein
MKYFNLMSLYYTFFFSLSLCLACNLKKRASKNVGCTPAVENLHIKFDFTPPKKTETGEVSSSAGIAVEISEKLQLLEHMHVKIIKPEEKTENRNLVALLSLPSLARFPQKSHA